MMFTPAPEVTLERYFHEPYNTIIAAARTCYSSKLIRVEDVTKDERAKELRDKIYDGIYEAGHHTTIQHPTFAFTLKNVSRQFIWSFLHPHPFYNSEQVSQRYVEVKRGNYAVPPLEGKAEELYVATADRMMKGYFKLIDLLGPDITQEYYKLYPKRAGQQRWENGIHKRVLEAARYVLPVATHAHLYHTISGITLHRYKKLAQQFDTPLESRIVVDKMVEAVNAVDPLFFRKVDDPIPLEDTLEYRIFSSHTNSRVFVKEFDADLGNRTSKLVDYKHNAERVMADSVRAMLGSARDRLSDADAIDLVMNPSKNRILGESLVLTTMSKLSRAMNHPHYTFRRKITHTADSQDQRHRMVPGSRPILEGQFVDGQPDYLLPPVFKKNQEAMDFTAKLMGTVWSAIGDLRAMGMPWEFAQYLLPNAFPIRFDESGDLMHFHHKWTTRLCYLAQEEIWRCCVEEVQQVRDIHPNIGKFLLPPCGLRKVAEQGPYCPEGDRYCGVPVWNKEVKDYERVI